MNIEFGPISLFNPLSMYLVKTDHNGDTIWTRLYDTGRLSGQVMLASTDDGGCILADTKESDGTIFTVSSITLKKISSTGSTEWVSNYGENSWKSSTCRALHQTDDGGYVVVGTTNLPAGFSSNSKIFLIKTEGNGSLTGK